ncbi:hypothetical protein [Streptomyces sp. NPDC046821]|uniref:hypothetical protein n=1 Tax=Streptomyces sp. NPDC046821 TaxID=3154702 RepID=UPI0033C5B087
MKSSSTVQRVWRLPRGERREHQAMCWSVGPQGELAVLLVRRSQLNRSRYVKGWPAWSPEVPFSGELVVVRGREERRTPLEDIRIRPRHLALLSDSRFLLAGGRAMRDGADGAWGPNAVVFSASGVPEAEFCVGDDIPVLVTDQRDRIWIVYGDEGIYGGHPESAGGLAGWNTKGDAVWLPKRRLPDFPLQGCTGATEGDRVWLAWYPAGRTYLTRITPSGDDVTSFPSPVPSPDGLAVRDDRAVLTVRHHNRRSVDVVRARLAGDGWTVTSRHRLRVPGRVVLYCGQGRDGFLWFRCGDTWLRIEA